MCTYTWGKLSAKCMWCIRGKGSKCDFLAYMVYGFIPAISMYAFIHSGHFYSASSSPLLLRGAPDYSTNTVSEIRAESHMQLQVKHLPMVSTWRLDPESNPRPSG